MTLSEAANLLQSLPTASAFAAAGEKGAPKETVQLAHKLSVVLGAQGLDLWSSHAPGLAQICEEAHAITHSRQFIFLPWEGYERASVAHGPSYYAPSHGAETQEIAQAVYSDYARRSGATSWSDLAEEEEALLVAATASFVDLNDDVLASDVICWTETKAISHEERSEKDGLTGQIISLASLAEIPVRNLSRPGDLEAERTWAEDKDLEIGI